MKISIGLPNKPMKPSANATHWPIIAAISVARTKPRRGERAARRMRPPPIGKAGIRLKSARNRFTDASRSTIETLALSTVASEPPSRVALVPRTNQDETERDHDIDQRARDRDEEFLQRFFRNALQPRNATDRKQDDIGCQNAEGARRQDVAEFMRQHAEEQKHHEEKAAPGRIGPGRDVASAQNPGAEGGRGRG